MKADISRHLRNGLPRSQGLRCQASAHVLRTKQRGLYLGAFRTPLSYTVYCNRLVPAVRVQKGGLRTGLARIEHDFSASVAPPSSKIAHRRLFFLRALKVSGLDILAIFYEQFTNI